MFYHQRAVLSLAAGAIGFLPIGSAHRDAARTVPFSAAADSTGLITRDFLQHWLALHKAFIKLPAAERSAAPVRKVQVMGDSTTAITVRDFGAIARTYPDIAAAFSAASVRPDEYVARYTQIARVWLGADMRKTLAPQMPFPLPGPDTTTVDGWNVALVLAHYDDFAASGIAYDFPSAQITEDSVPAGTHAPALAVGHWINPSTDFPGVKPLQFGDGHLYIVAFTAPWCEGCPFTYAPLAAVAKRYADEGVRVLFTTTGMSAFGTLSAYFARHHVTLPVAVEATDEPMGSNAAQFKVTSLPVVLMIDPHGVIRHRWSGGTTDSAAYAGAVSKAADQLLAEGAGK